MRILRDASTPQGDCARAMLALIAATAVIVGLIAMHLLSPGMAHTPTAGTSPPTALTSETAPHHDDAAHHSSCDQPCPSGMPDHEMSATACALALSASFPLIASPVVAWEHAPTPQAQLVAGWRATEAESQPPSLLVLSIRRT